ncbi:hypothetical protein OS493_001130 [Desmophyllum pertusum]|uniref:Uncharacterized protein n=1 Tax=Desmophyllum pertusum TaxID=174260 RepID=A0A9W9ZTY7_9CNID|nr:hypothetical protein OS493_001130 [Desmophyllum pertusum]
MAESGEISPPASVEACTPDERVNQESSPERSKDSTASWRQQNDLDLFDCLKLVEQSVSLLGQAKVSLSYSCRLAVLFHLTGDLKKAKKLISKHETSLTKSHKTLFGKTFYKALRTATKIRKYTKEISHHITGSTTQPPPRSYRGRKNLKQYSRSSQPFRQNRGGSTSVSFRGKSSTYRGYPKGKSVKFRVKKRAPGSKRPTPDRNKNSGYIVTDSPKGHLSGPDKTKFGFINSKQVLSIGIETPNQLDIADTRSVHFTNCHWSGDSLSENPTPDKHSPTCVSQ